MHNSKPRMRETHVELSHKECSLPTKCTLNITRDTMYINGNSKDNAKPLKENWYLLAFIQNYRANFNIQV
jgi:hypothetical protein